MPVVCDYLKALCTHTEIYSSSSWSDLQPGGSQGSPGWDLQPAIKSMYSNDKSRGV